jgi:hypothetical protein
MQQLSFIIRWYVMEEGRRKELWLRYSEHIRGHLWHIYSITATEVIMASINKSKGWLQLSLFFWYMNLKCIQHDWWLVLRIGCCVQECNCTKDRVTRTPLNTGGELRCSGRVSSYCSTSVTHRVNLIRSIYSKDVQLHSWTQQPILKTSHQSCWMHFRLE